VRQYHRHTPLAVESPSRFSGSDLVKLVQPGDALITFERPCGFMQVHAALRAPNGRAKTKRAQPGDMNAPPFPRALRVVPAPSHPALALSGGLVFLPYLFPNLLLASCKWSRGPQTGELAHNPTRAFAPRRAFAPTHVRTTTHACAPLHVHVLPHTSVCYHSSRQQLGGAL